ncbi:hypothetical protein LXL04_034001 [Taraxacum kok-saghyz]
MLVKGEVSGSSLTNNLPGGKPKDWPQAIGWERFTALPARGHSFSGEMTTGSSSSDTSLSCQPRGSFPLRLSFCSGDINLRRDLLPRRLSSKCSRRIPTSQFHYYRQLHGRRSLGLPESLTAAMASRKEEGVAWECLSEVGVPLLAIVTGGSHSPHCDNHYRRFPSASNSIHRRYLSRSLLVADGSEFDGRWRNSHESMKNDLIAFREKSDRYNKLVNWQPNYEA